MRTIIAGSRDITDYNLVMEACASCPWEITRVVSGTARGVDRLGERWAKERHIPIDRYPADWFNQGKAAGHIRNALMAKNAEALIAIWNGVSPGTLSMIGLAKKAGLHIYIHRV